MKTTALLTAIIVLGLVAAVIVWFDGAEIKALRGRALACEATLNSCRCTGP